MIKNKILNIKIIVKIIKNILSSNFLFILPNIKKKSF